MARRIIRDMRGHCCSCIRTCIGRRDYNPGQVVRRRYRNGSGRKIGGLDITSSLVKGNTSVNFSENGFFCLKFSLNLLEYEAKGFIHGNFSYLFIFAFFLSRVGRLSYLPTKQLNLKTSTRSFRNTYFQNATHHNSNNFQYFLFKF